LESFWENNRFGRTAVVLPTNTLIDLGGRVSQSFLSNLGIEAREIQKSAATITSAQVAVLTCSSPLPEDLVLLASTVFNSRFTPHARDQWNAAQAILDQADNLNCTLVLVPPLGTGSFDWPVTQAVVNWIYGAIRWTCRRPTTTNLSVWPVVCVPGPGDQKIVANYLRNFTTSRREALMGRQIGIRLRYNNEESEEKFVRDDLLLGGLARNIDREFKRDLNWRFRHGKNLRKRSSQQPFEYHADMAIAETIFADGDTIELIQSVDRS